MRHSCHLAFRYCRPTEGECIFAMRRHGTRSPALAAVRRSSYRVNARVRCAADQLQPRWDQLTSSNEAFPNQTATWTRRRRGLKYDHHQPANVDHDEVVAQPIASESFYVSANNKRRRNHVLWPSVRLSVRPLTPILHDTMSLYLLDETCHSYSSYVSGYCLKGLQGRRRSKVKVTRVNSITAEACISRFTCLIPAPLHLLIELTYTPLETTCSLMTITY